MKQPTGMANMAPGFLIWLAKTNCFFLSQLTHHASASFISNINPQSLPTSASPSQFLIIFFVKFSHLLPINTNTAPTKKVQRKHTHDPCTTSLLLVFFFNLITNHYTLFPCFLCSCSSGYWVPLFCIFERFFGVPIW